MTMDDDGTVYCRHNIAEGCSERCRRCGHQCFAHSHPGDPDDLPGCSYFVNDTVVEHVCPCTGFSDDPVGIEAMAEAVEGK